MHQLADRIRGTRWFGASGVARTLLVVLVSLARVRSGSLAAWWTMRNSLIGMGPSSGRHWVPTWAVLLIGLVAMQHAIGEWWADRSPATSVRAPARAVLSVVVVAAPVVFGRWGEQPFIYFQF